MPKQTIEVDSKELAKILIRGGALAGVALSAALYKEAATIFEESQDEVPLDTGNLRASGKLGLPEIQGNELVG